MGCCTSCFGDSSEEANLMPSPETRRRQQLEAAEKRQHENETRGIKNIEAVRRQQQRSQELERDFSGAGGAPLKLLACVSSKNGRRKEMPRVDLFEDSWTGKWFPYDPTEKTTMQHKLPSDTCDYVNNEKISVDFDPAKKTFSYKYLCLGNRTQYSPEMQREAVLTQHFIPPAYKAPVICLNESITYEAIPTFGPHRLFAPKYGEYKFLPPQRWLKSLASGAIVMLYHPCACPAQIAALKSIVSSCLYRHIITPSQKLAPDRPLALVAWGNLLQMSVVDDHIVVNFIKQFAKQNLNPEQYEKVPSHFYDAGLVSEARLVTDEEDSEICSFKNL